MNKHVFVALGGNVGDRELRLTEAMRELAGHPAIEVVRVSSYLETRPAGGPSGQGAYLNAAAELETALAPFELMSALLEIERRAGRERSVRWGPRTLDLDLLLYGDLTLATDTLVLPHPRLCVRAFVLEPLAEIAPEMHEPTTGLSVRELLENLRRRPRIAAIDGLSLEATDRIIAELESRAPAWRVVRADRTDLAPAGPTLVIEAGDRDAGAIEMPWAIPRVRVESLDCHAMIAEISAILAGAETEAAPDD